MDLLRFATAGSVDDGKSTLIGRLLYDSKSVFQDQLESVERTSADRGDDYTNLALLTDGLRAEREQGITIDVAYRYFSTPRRSFIVADTPGHVQYTRNMVTGASTADLALVLVDARKGVIEQTRRHASLSALLRVPHLVLAVNKMDLVDWDRSVFDAIAADFREFAGRLDVEDVVAIPMSALAGDNVVDRSPQTPWYDGPTLLEHLETVHVVREAAQQLPARFPVQYVIRPMSTERPDYRGYAGTLASGRLRPGDEVAVLPSGRRTTVAALDTFDGELAEAVAGQAVTVRLADEVDVSRGDMLVAAEAPSGRRPERRGHRLLDGRRAAASRPAPAGQAHDAHVQGHGRDAARPARRDDAGALAGDRARPQRHRPGHAAHGDAAVHRRLRGGPPHRRVHPGGRGDRRHRRRGDGRVALTSGPRRACSR